MGGRYSGKKSKRLSNSIKKIKRISGGLFGYKKVGISNNLKKTAEFLVDLKYFNTEAAFQFVVKRGPIGVKDEAFKIYNLMYDEKILDFDIDNLQFSNKFFLGTDKSKLLITILS
jgi:hypothetical protein